MNQNITPQRLPLVKVEKRNKKQINQDRINYLENVISKMEDNKMMYRELGQFNYKQRTLAIEKYVKEDEKINKFMYEIAVLHKNDILKFLIGKIHLNPDIVRYGIAPYIDNGFIPYYDADEDEFISNY